ncbi:MAG: alpha/beta hydrolase [Candidatus Thorarchaeota archaeon]|nr:alpha/beta hydrolase [Candidatus Thorarchaeota archaeon]
MSVHIEEFGDQDTTSLILVHGAGGSSATWFMQLRGLQDRFHVIAIDLNGHGRTPDRNESDILQSYLDDIDHIVTQFNKPYLGGHSMGGALTQLYSLRYPDKLSGIILIGTGGRLRVHPMIFEMLRNNFDEYVRSSASFMFDESTSSEVITASQKEIRKCKPSIIERDFRACDGFDIMDKVSRINLPTLILVGENDQMTPEKYSTYLHENIKKSVMRAIPKAGHAVMLEQSELLNRSIAEWVLEQKK